MKKILSVLLVTMMVLSCFSVVSFAEESYDATITLTPDSDSYQPGEFMKVTVEIDKIIKAQSVRWHFTYDSDLLELVDAEKVNPESDKFDEEYMLPFYQKYKVFVNSVNDFPNSSGEPTIVEKGEYSVALLSTTSGGAALGGNTWEKKPLYTVYFKVKDTIKGTNEINFKWVKNTANNPTGDPAVFVKYLENPDETQNYSKYNINFVDGSTMILGEKMAEDSQFLPQSYAFAEYNEFENNTIEINGVKKQLPSRYAVAYSKVAPRNDGVIKETAGFILSAENKNLTIDNKDLKNFEALNFSSENIFIGLFYGKGLEAGKTYYVMPYVTYTDGVTLYASEAQSFTMPK